ncbi:MAG: hypothetical protein ACTSWT_01920 [Candidatus Heimdallarchaeota archaeon]
MIKNKQLAIYDKHVRKEIWCRVQGPVDDETLLKSFIVKYQKEFPTIMDYPYLVEFDYEIFLGRTDRGEGALLFDDKYFNVEKSIRYYGQRGNYSFYKTQYLSSKRFT